MKVCSQAGSANWSCRNESPFMLIMFHHIVCSLDCGSSAAASASIIIIQHTKGFQSCALLVTGPTLVIGGKYTTTKDFGHITDLPQASTLVIMVYQLHYMTYGTLGAGSHHRPATRGAGHPPGADAGPHAVPPGAAAGQHPSAASWRKWPPFTASYIHSIWICPHLCYAI